MTAAKAMWPIRAKSPAYLFRKITNAEDNENGTKSTPPATTTGVRPPRKRATFPYRKEHLWHLIKSLEKGIDCVQS
jgi:hypothetical protein